MAKLNNAIAKSATEVTPNELAFSLLHDAVGTETTLDKLIPLDATPIKYATYAMRELNAANLANIYAAIENNVALPPVKIVNTTLGLVITDGYHRYAAYAQHLAQVLRDASDHDDEFVSEEQMTKNFQAAASMYPVGIEQVFPHSERDVINAAFKANLEHGLAASETSRTRYALWILEMNRLDLQPGEKPMSVREASRLALVSHVAVLKAAKKIAKQMKMVDGTPLTVEETQEADALQDPEMTATQKQVDALDRAIQSLAKSIKVMTEQKLSDDDLQSICTQAVGEMKNFYKEDVSSVSKILNYMFKAAKNRPIAEDASPVVAVVAPVESQQA